MIKPTMSIKGTETMIKNLKKASKRVQKRAEKVVLAFAWMVHNDAKFMCPVDTGRLRGSISVNWTMSGMSYGKVSGVAEMAEGIGQPSKVIPGFCAAVGTNVAYAEPVENRSPYLWPAFAMNKGKYLAMMAAALKVELSSL